MSNAWWRKSQRRSVRQRPLCIMPLQTLYLTRCAEEIAEMDWEDFDAHAQTGLRGALNLIHAVKPLMAQRNFGRIIHIGTTCSRIPLFRIMIILRRKRHCWPQRTAAAELGPDGITVNMVSAGYCVPRMPVQQRQRPCLTSSLNPHRYAL